MRKLNVWIMAGVVLFCALPVIASAAPTFSSVASFNGADGSAHKAPLVQGLNGNFYGTTQFGGGALAIS